MAAPFSRMLQKHGSHEASITLPESGQRAFVQRLKQKEAKASSAGIVTRIDTFN